MIGAMFFSETRFQKILLKVYYKTPDKTDARASARDKDSKTVKFRPGRSGYILDSTDQSKNTQQSQVSRSTHSVQGKDDGSPSGSMDGDGSIPALNHTTDSIYVSQNLQSQPLYEEEDDDDDIIVPVSRPNQEPTRPKKRELKLFGDPPTALASDDGRDKETENT
jgi:hypothetical protein